MHQSHNLLEERLGVPGNPRDAMLGDLPLQPLEQDLKRTRASLLFMPTSHDRNRLIENNVEKPGLIASLLESV